MKKGRFTLPCTEWSRKDGFSSEWGVSENNRRARFYRLTALGRKQLNAERDNWKKITTAVALVLAFQPE